MNSNKNELALIGFIKIGKWEVDGDNKLNPCWDDPCNGYIKIDNALYAFVEVNEKNEEIEVKYIGKTSKSIENRFKGYRSPGNTTATNANCNREIRDSLKNKNKLTIEIWAFTPTIPFQILGYNVNLAAGLEDDLIWILKPKWNGGKTAFAIAEIDLEKIDKAKIDLDSLSLYQDASNSEPQKDFNSPACKFDIKLGVTYFNTGSINPGIVASTYLGNHGEAVKIYLGSEDLCVASTINTTANPNGSVRISGNNFKIAEWFQTKFKQGDIVNALVIDKNTIFLREPN
jgi:hypothetical protein